ncbi:MAG: hypothetical protein P4L41_12700 [Flavipsychrobacter sp.]|nr:hypothetical protein [Flavipsychrobacter sp.]
MKKENDILGELKEWGSPLADMSRAMPYEVPSGYFESNIKEISVYTVSDELVAGSNKMPFAVPNGFFEAFPQQILETAKMESIEFKGSKEMPFTVPQGYFESVSKAILTQVNKPVGASRTITFVPRRWMRQAIAAIFLVAVGIGGYKYEMHKHLSPEKQLASVPVKSVQEYVHQNLNDVDAEASIPVASTDVTVVNAIGKLDKSDIEQYLDETGLKTEYNIN